MVRCNTCFMNAKMKRVKYKYGLTLIDGHNNKYRFLVLCQKNKVNVLTQQSACASRDISSISSGPRPRRQTAVIDEIRKLGIEVVNKGSLGAAIGQRLGADQNQSGSEFDQVTIAAYKSQINDVATKVVRVKVW